VTGAIAAGSPDRSLLVRGRRYPVVLPKLSDPRLHLAAVITSLQILGQTVLDFRVSIAQILIALGTCAVLELGITSYRQKAIIWPASAMLTGNGIGFILRVPGTAHGDWWSVRGGWIYCGTAAVALLSKYLIKHRGGHIFNPSNFGIVACLLILGSSRVEPLDFWWGPMSPALALALAIIVGGAFLILRRLKLLRLALAFWATFALALIPVAIAGHGITARWHLGPVSGFYLWWILVTSPEILIFLFFMITDPKTIPRTARGRIVYSVAIAVLAVLLLAPATTEFGAKLAVLGALTIVCVCRPLVEHVLEKRPLAFNSRRLPAFGLVAIAGLVLVLTLISAPPRGYKGTKLASVAGWPAAAPRHVPPFTIVPNPAVSARLSHAEAQKMAADVVVALGLQTQALELRSEKRLRIGTDAIWKSKLEERLTAARGSGPLAVPNYHVSRLTFTLVPRPGQLAPAIMATLHGQTSIATWSGAPPRRVSQTSWRPLLTAFEIAKTRTHYQLVSDDLPQGWRPKPQP
jgi:Na+-translocating ferredoxin:NAD+ oxidoreductase RnfD subunit